MHRTTTRSLTGLLLFLAAGQASSGTPRFRKRRHGTPVLGNRPASLPGRASEPVAVMDDSIPEFEALEDEDDFNAEFEGPLLAEPPHPIRPAPRLAFSLKRRRVRPCSHPCRSRIVVPGRARPCHPCRAIS